MRNFNLVYLPTTTGKSALINKMCTNWAWKSASSSLAILGNQLIVLYDTDCFMYRHAMTLFPGVAPGQQMWSECINPNRRYFEKVAIDYVCQIREWAQRGSSASVNTLPHVVLTDIMNPSNYLLSNDIDPLEFDCAYTRTEEAFTEEWYKRKQNANVPSTLLDAQSKNIDCDPINIVTLPIAFYATPQSLFHQLTGGIL